MEREPDATGDAFEKFRVLPHDQSCQPASSASS
jgi:hypothetical protein